MAWIIALAIAAGVAYLIYRSKKPGGGDGSTTPRDDGSQSQQ